MIPFVLLVICEAKHVRYPDDIIYISLSFFVSKVCKLYTYNFKKKKIIFQKKLFLSEKLMVCKQEMELNNAGVGHCCDAGSIL